MCWAPCQLALVAIGLFGSPQADDAMVGYQVGVYEMRGLDWRGKLYGQLEPVRFDNGTSIWLAPKACLATLAGTSGSTLYNPKPATGREVRAEIRTTMNRRYVSSLERMADGPVGNATALAYKPRIDTIEESINVAVQCTRANGGTQTAVAIDETRLASIATYTIEEQVQPKDNNGIAKPSRLGAQIQVPEIVHSEVEGEWIVPHGHVLIVGLGVHTTPQAKGPPVLLERVAVIEPLDDLPKSAPTVTDDPTQDKTTAISPQPIARAGYWVAARSDAVPPPLMPITMRPAAQSPMIFHAPGGGNTIVIVVPGSHAPFTPQAAPIAMRGVPIAFAQPVASPVATFEMRLPTPGMVAPMPPVPARALPTPRNDKGEVVDLPPLPELEKPEADASAEPLGSPQAPHAPGPRPGGQEPAQAPGVVAAGVIKPREHIGIDFDFVVDARGGQPLLAPRMFTISNVNSQPQSEKCDHACCQTAKHAYSTANPAKIPALDLPSTSDVSDCRKISLSEAIQTALTNAKLVRVSTSDGSRVLFVPPGRDPFEVKAQVQARIVEVTKAYWDLCATRTRHWALDADVAFREQVVRRELAKPEADSASERNLALERLEHAKLGFLEATRDLGTTQRILREAMGETDTNAKLLSPIDSPKDEPFAMSWGDCLATMRSSNPTLASNRDILIKSCESLFRPDPTSTASATSTTSSKPHVELVAAHVIGSDVHSQTVSLADPTESGEKLTERVRESLRSLHQSTHELARRYLQCETQFKLYQTATKLAQSAAVRREAQRAFHEQGTITLDRYQDAIGRWSNAVAQRSEILARYNTALAMLEEIKGTLIASSGWEFATEPAENVAHWTSAAKHDAEAVRVDFTHPDEKPRGSIKLGFSIGTRTPVVSSKPTSVVLPFGGIFAIDVKVDSPSNK